MNKLSTLLKEKIKVGCTYKNPKSGTSKIKSFDNEGITYIRGASFLFISWRDIDSAYEHFKGTYITTRDLKNFNKHAFEYPHPCNSTFFMMLLENVNLIEGKISGYPFGIKIKEF